MINIMVYAGWTKLSCTFVGRLCLWLTCSPKAGTCCVTKLGALQHTCRPHRLTNKLLVSVNLTATDTLVLLAKVGVKLLSLC